MMYPVDGGDGGALTMQVWVGMCHQKGSNFQSLSGMGGVFHYTNSVKRLKYTCLERGPCLSGKGLLDYLGLELEYDK